VKFVPARRIGTRGAGTFSASLGLGPFPTFLVQGGSRAPGATAKELPSDFLDMYQHATYTGVGSEKKTAHLRAKHAAYDLFLKKYAPRQ
jgi:hypothetical protein